ncbi:MAG: hypothetical protein ABR600_01135, partial [Actinomycetota bacterium]
ETVYAKKVDTGIYKVEFAYQLPCGSPQGQLATVVSAHPANGAAIASSMTICENTPVELVRVVSTDGSPLDAAFTLVLLMPTRALP